MTRTLPRTLPDRDYLLVCFDYDPKSGILRWRRRPYSHFPSVREWGRWNTRHAGVIAGNKHHIGYSLIKIDAVLWASHRIIFKMVTGKEPPQIDHINGIRNDNRWINLRAASAEQNMRNQRRARELPKGVRLMRWGRYCSRIGAGGAVHLGVFDTAEEAHAAYCEEARRRYGEFWHP